MDTNSVVGTQRVEGVCSTYKQATMLAEQDLDEITALSLWRKTQKEMIREEKKITRFRETVWTIAKLKTTSQSKNAASVKYEKYSLKQSFNTLHLEEQ